MAVELRLECGALTTLDLNAAAGAGFRVMAWNPAVATPVYGKDPPVVVESLDMMLESTTHNDMASDVQDLDAYRVQCDAYMRDRTTQDPVWLRCKMDGETSARRALVTQMDDGLRSALYTVGCEPGDNKARFRLQITRMPYWEAPVETTIMNGITPAAGAAVILDYAASNLVGDVPARPYYVGVLPGANSDEFGRLWMGIRSAAKAGTPANFKAIWECEDGTNGTDAADGGDATASDGNKVTVTPGTATWAKRMTITMSQAGAPYADNFGRMLWLLRTKVSAGTWEVQLRFGYSAMADDDFVRGPVVEVDNDAWDYKECGTSTIPFRNTHVFDIASYGASTDSEAAVQVWARRTGGAGTLDLDCLCPIPVDEWYLKTAGFTASRTAADDYEQWYCGESPEHTQQGLVFYLNLPATHYVTHVATIEGKLRFPPGDGRLIMVYARATTSDITDTITAYADIYYRWLTLRGNDVWVT